MESKTKVSLFIVLTITFLLVGDGAIVLYACLIWPNVTREDPMFLTGIIAFLVCFAFPFILVGLFCLYNHWELNLKNNTRNYYKIDLLPKNFITLLDKVNELPYKSTEDDDWSTPHLEAWNLSSSTPQIHDLPDYLQPFPNSSSSNYPPSHQNSFNHCSSITDSFKHLNSSINNSFNHLNISVNCSYNHLDCINNHKACAHNHDNCFQNHVDCVYSLAIPKHSNNPLGNLNKIAIPKATNNTLGNHNKIARSVRDPGSSIKKYEPYQGLEVPELRENHYRNDNIKTLSPSPLPQSRLVRLQSNQLVLETESV